MEFQTNTDYIRSVSSEIKMSEINERRHFFTNFRINFLRINYDLCILISIDGIRLEMAKKRN